MNHVMLIGAGGNIGSHLVPLLARIPEIGRLTLIDRDRYEARNRENQDLPPGVGAVGRNKATVQAARARRLNRGLAVQAVAEDVETLPLGRLRCDLILAALDSRRARQRVNQAALRLGIPWLDGGVLGAGMLARITRYVPGEDLPCLECRWDPADYAALEQSYPCEGAPAPATTAPAGLGALTAALLALECRKLLRGEAGALPPGAELVLDAAHHRHYVTGVRRNPACRIGSHAPWPVEPLAVRTDESLGAALAALRQRTGANGDLAVSFDGKLIARRLSCEDCGAVKPILRLFGSLRPGVLRCARCGGRAAPNGFGLLERLEAASLTRPEGNRSLAALGVRSGEILTCTAGGRDTHFELRSKAP